MYKQREVCFPDRYCMADLGLFEGMTPSVHSFAQGWSEGREELCFPTFAMKLPLFIRLVFRLSIPTAGPIHGEVKLF